MLNTALVYLSLKHPGSVICWKLPKKTGWALVQLLICGSCSIMSICFTHINSIHLLSVFLSAGFVILRTGGQFVCTCVNPLNDNSEGALILMAENWKLAQKFIHFFSRIIGVLIPVFSYKRYSPPHKSEDFNVGRKARFWDKQYRQRVKRYFHGKMDKTLTTVYLKQESLVIVFLILFRIVNYLLNT